VNYDYFSVQLEFKGLSLDWKVIVFLNLMNTTMEKGSFIILQVWRIILDYYCNSVGNYKNHVNIQLDENSPSLELTIESNMFLLWPSMFFLFFFLKTGLTKLNVNNSPICHSIQGKNIVNLWSLHMCNDLRDNNGTSSIISNTFGTSHKSHVSAKLLCSFL